MARRKSKTLTELELEIMQLIWKGGDVTVEDLRRGFAEKGTSLALPTIRTMLKILQKKGHVTRKPRGRGYVYRAIVDETQAGRRFLKDIVDRAFDGSALKLVSTLLNSNIVSEKDLDEVRRLIQEKEKEKP